MDRRIIHAAVTSGKKLVIGDDRQKTARHQPVDLSINAKKHVLSCAPGDVC